MHETKCPACGSPEHYRLKDQRLQCADCRKKYTARKQRSRLPEETLYRIVQGFWRMIPATALALEQGINSKTLQKYYDRLRRAITEINERYAVEQFGATTVAAGLFHDLAQRKGLGPDVSPLFCLARNREKVSLLLAEESVGELAVMAIPEIVGWVYAQDRKALCSLDLDRIHFLPAVTGRDHGETHFWITAKRGLVKYHGGFRKNFYLFMREMEFRFNNHDEDWTRDFLLTSLQRDITIETGEENVQV